MKCKYCGAEPLYPNDTEIRDWKCGTWVRGTEHAVVSDECRDSRLGMFEAMFPVLPWDDSPVTTEVCERLGMNLLEVVGTMLDSDYRGITAGQLALLVAVRKAET